MHFLKFYKLQLKNFILFKGGFANKTIFFVHILFKRNVLRTKYLKRIYFYLLGDILFKHKTKCYKDQPRLYKSRIRPLKSFVLPCVS